MAIKNVFVIGAGVMGSGIAQVSAEAGYNVTILDIKEEFLSKGLASIEKGLDRKVKKGTVQETLDIVIADELGTRNYEMYSGGEAFRINFAVRIALSRLLARRAGAPLPTLIIDEGFGTQDSTGMERLKEAINTIQDDFEKIIVITHIDELKEAFPARIDVWKTVAGSQVAIR